MNYDGLDGTGRTVKQNNAKPTDKSPLALITISHQHPQDHTCMYLQPQRWEGKGRDRSVRGAGVCPSFPSLDF